LLGASHIPLAEVCAEAIAVEAHDKDIVELVFDGGSVGLKVLAAAVWDSHIAVPATGS
jgi:hypothetical protein